MTSVRGDLALLEEIRSHGPFEDWRARPDPALELPRRLLARRSSGERDDAAALAHRLATAARVADRVSHHLVLQTYGVLETPDGAVLQLSEDFDGVALDQMPILPLLSVPAAVVIARQLLDALAHAHALGVTHRAVAPSAVWLGRYGDVKVDFGLCGDAAADAGQTTPVDVRFCHPEWTEAEPLHPKIDVYAVSALLWWLLVGEPYRVTAGPITHYPASRSRAGIPTELDLALEAGLGVNPMTEPSTARELAERLDRVFYKDLEAEFDRDGSSEIAAWIADHLVERSDPELDDSILAVESVQGRLTLALAARDRPVPPSDLSGGVEAVAGLTSNLLGGPTGETPTPPEASSLHEPDVTSAEPVDPAAEDAPTRPPVGGAGPVLSQVGAPPPPPPRGSSPSGSGAAEPWPERSVQRSAEVSPMPITAPDSASGVDEEAAAQGLASSLPVAPTPTPLAPASSSRGGATRAQRASPGTPTPFAPSSSSRGGSDSGEPPSPESSLRSSRSPPRVPPAARSHPPSSSSSTPPVPSSSTPPPASSSHPPAASSSAPVLSGSAPEERAVRPRRGWVHGLEFLVGMLFTVALLWWLGY